MPTRQCSGPLGHALSQAGYEVLASGDGPEALRIVRSDKPALVLVAANLPGVDGFTVVARLRDGGRPVHAHAGHRPAGRERGRRSRQGPSSRRRRLPDQAVPSGRADGPDAQPAGPLQARRAVHPDHLTDRARHPAAAPAPKKREPARVVLFYGAKGGVGTTTIAINAAIALHKELGRRVCLIDANLQFGDHRVFLDLGFDRMSVVDLATAPAVDIDLIRQVLVKHESGIELLLGPPSPETAELVTHDAPARHHRLDVQRVRLHPRRCRQASGRSQPSDHGRGRRRSTS